MCVCWSSTPTQLHSTVWLSGGCRKYKLCLSSPPLHILIFALLYLLLFPFGSTLVYFSLLLFHDFLVAFVLSFSCMSIALISLTDIQEESDITGPPPTLVFPMMLFAPVVWIRTEMENKTLNTSAAAEELLPLSYHSRVCVCVCLCLITSAIHLSLSPAWGLEPRRLCVCVCVWIIHGHKEDPQLFFVSRYNCTFSTSQSDQLCFIRLCLSVVEYSKTTEPSCSEVLLLTVNSCRVCSDCWRNNCTNLSKAMQKVFFCCFFEEKKVLVFHFIFWLSDRHFLTRDWL